jgi:flagellar protein FlgJ
MDADLLRTSPLTTGFDITAPAGKPKDAADAARQFEALLIYEMLKSAKSSESEAAAAGDDQSGSALSDLAEQQFAQLLASNGGIGLAKLVKDGLATRDAASRPSSDADRSQSRDANRTTG